MKLKDKLREYYIMGSNNLYYYEVVDVNETNKTIKLKKRMRKTK